MKYDLEITDDNLKSTIEKNILDRNKKICMLSKILSSVDENFVLSIDGKWGSGKTFFIRQFEYIINNLDSFKDNSKFSNEDKDVLKKIKDNNLIIYYNAWENDMYNKPLESILYTILNKYPEFKDRRIDDNQFIDIFKDVFKDIIKAFSFETIDLKHVDKIKTFKELAEEIYTIEEKKNLINKLLDLIINGDNRIIFIIDELDRCKPSYAVELLETIKHFYSNKKISFICVTNNSELSKTIKKYYGNDFNSYEYLNKFYDLTISLEQINMKKYLQNQLDFSHNSSAFNIIAFEVMDYFSFSLRECNRYVKMHKMLSNYIEAKYIFDKEYYSIFTLLLIPLGLGLKIHDIEKYNLYMSNNGEKIIEDFIEKRIYKKYDRLFKEFLKEEDYKCAIIEKYKESFSQKMNVDRFPFLDVMSLLADKIKINS